MYEFSYVQVFIAAIIQFILGALWYSPIMFGSSWMEIMGAKNISKDKLKKMQRAMTPFYILQFILGLFTIVSLANLMVYVNYLNLYNLAFWIWAGFIAPIQIGAVIWANTEKKYWLKQIIITISYSLASLMISSFILSI
jgi:hypothetical protein